MSGKKEKQLRNAEQQKLEESQKRQESFMKEVQELSRKYKVDMVAAIQYKKTAIVPTIVLVDVKDQYEQVVKNEEAKKQAQPEEVKKEEEPAKLEL